MSTETDKKPEAATDEPAAASADAPKAAVAASGQAYAEPEKLGSLGAPPALAPAGFGPDADVRASLVAAFRDAIAAAKDATGRDDLDEGVHELRKALRRARAIVRLVADTLSRDDRRDLSRALVEARRTLSASRDLAVAPAALVGIELAEGDRAAAEAIVAGARDGGPAGDALRAHLDEAGSRVAPLADVMAAALPVDVSWGDLADGLAETYRRARRSLRRARRSHTAFHDFRKRTKELTYQLDVLATGTDGRATAMRRELADLGDELGAVVDVIMLRGFVAAHAGDADPATVASLTAAIDAELARIVKAARRRAKPLFERAPTKFARRVRKAVRRDHAPPAAEATEATDAAVPAGDDVVTPPPGPIAQA